MYKLLSRHLVFVLTVYLTACQSFVEVVTQAGDDGLLWPLPPTPTRLIYDEEINIAHSMSKSVNLVTGTSRYNQIVRPHRVAAVRDMAAIVDRETGVPYLIDRIRNKVIILKHQDGKPLTSVSDVALDDMKRVYLLDSINRQVMVFEENGTVSRQFGSALMWFKPDRLAVDVLRQRLYVADSFQHRVYVFSLGGAFLYMFGEQGKDVGRFSGMRDIVVDTDGNLYILESTTLRIQKFTPQGQWLQSIDLDRSRIFDPVAIAVEKNHVIYLADSYKNYISIFDMQGNHIFDLGQLGRRRGSFSDLMDISFDQYRQYLVSSEASLSRLQVFRRTAVEWLPYP